MINTDHREKKSRLTRLAKQIESARKAYFQEDSPLLSDGEYDSLIKRYREIIKKNPELASNIDPLLQVGSTPSKAFTKVCHDVPLLSLANALKKDDVTKFDESIKRFLGLELSCDISYVAEPKIDGLSLALKYRKGKLVTAATRGDGDTGEDVTHNAITIGDIPKRISNAPAVLEVRGEVYILKNDFVSLNEFQKSENQKMFANARNAAAGSLRQLDSNITKQRPLRFFAYSLAGMGHNLASSQEQLLKVLSQFGFSINHDYQICAGIDELFQAYELICNKRELLEYEVDGIVYKVNDFNYQERLGSRSNSPRWAIAHKFPPKESFTKLISIEIQVGRTGTLSPVAKLEPVEIGGVIVSSATLHNEDFIRGYDNTGAKIRDGIDIRVGDLVSVYRAGDVIPKIKSINLSERSRDSEPFVFPISCPECGSKVIKEKNESVTRCNAGLSCRAQVLERLKHFVSKQGFCIDGFGEKQIINFYDLGWLSQPADIFRLRKNHGENSEKPLEELVNWGKKSADKLFNSIETSRTISLEKFINALGIRYVGEVVSLLLARYYECWPTFYTKMISISEGELDVLEELYNIDGIGLKSAEELKNYFSNKENQILCEELASEINVIKSISKRVSSPVSGLTVVFTGSLHSMTRSEAKSYAEKMGAKVSNTISSKTDILISGDGAGLKLKKAKEFGIKVLAEKDWFNLIKT